MRLRWPRLPTFRAAEAGVSERAAGLVAVHSSTMPAKYRPPRHWKNSMFAAWVVVSMMFLVTAPAAAVRAANLDSGGQDGLHRDPGSESI